MLVPTAAEGGELARRLLGDWLKAVREHQPGESDEAFQSLARLSHADLDLLQPYVDAVILTALSRREWPQRQRRVDPADSATILEAAKALGNVTIFRKKAVVLHSDLALSGAAIAEVDAPIRSRRQTFAQRQRPVDRVLVRSRDGQVESFELASLHWEFAMDILNTMARPVRDPIVPLWYRAVGAYFANEYRFGDALLHWERARRVAADDPGVMYGEACLHETLAAPRVQEFVRRTTLPNGLIVQGVWPAPVHLERAEALLKKVVATDRPSHDAALRLARVLTLQKKPAEALPLVQRVIAADVEPVLLYYAFLVGGDASEGITKLRDAREYYERAMKLFPRAQSARLALARLSRINGDQEAAAAVLIPALGSADARDDDDPWWNYFLGDAPNVTALLEQVRDSVRQ
jgi:hypothetical protein